MELGIDKDLGGKRSLRDEFAITDNDDASDISAALYKEELNEQKIEKLSNRITIFSIFLLCLISVVMIYGYLDIKERVMVIHNSGQTQVDVVAKEFETKLNSFEVEMAKIKFNLEKDIPELKQQTISIQDELTLLAGTKSDKEETDKNLELIKTSVDKIAEQYQSAIHILDRTNQETLDIVNEKAKEIEAAMEVKTASVKTMQSEIDAKIVSIKAIESEIESKIDSRIKAVVDKQSEAAIDNRVKNIINEKISSHSQSLDKKVADLDLSVESKLAALQEVTHILAENKNTITTLEATIKELRNGIDKLDKDFRSYQLKVASELEKKQQEENKKTDKNTDIDKQYVDSQIITLKKSINAKIDQLDLNLSRKILQYATQLEEANKRKNLNTKNKNESTTKTNSTKHTEYPAQETKSEIILTEPKRGKISETDLTD